MDDGSIIRATATEKREAAWEIDDNILDEMLGAGCEYCDRGWAHGPGLLYRCQCNPGEPSEIKVPGKQ